MTPAELMRAVLQAPVDLLWNGGIGTYVKAADETDADAGDKANDAIRVNGRDLRAQCVGEGGNLGLTQLGRIEYAERGGRMNTDFIDNSAGVDTSDHEVNIKILLDRVVADGDLTEKQRNALLAADDRRGRRPGAARQLRAEPRARQRRGQRAVVAARARGLDAPAREARRPQPRARGTALDPPGTPDARARGGSERPRALGAARLDQDRAGRGAARLRPARRPLLPRRPDGLLPRAHPAGLRRPGRRAPAAPRDHRHPGRQRPRQRRRPDLLAAAPGRDGRRPGRAHPGQLRGPRDLRVAALPRRGRLPRQRARGGGADPDAHRDAHARRAGVAMADHQPAPTARQPGHGRVLPRPGAGGDA